MCGVCGPRTLVFFKLNKKINEKRSLSHLGTLKLKTWLFSSSFPPLQFLKMLLRRAENVAELLDFFSCVLMAIMKSNKNSLGN